MTAALVVLAKTPAPGRVKTRLCPPLDPTEAAMLAAAALADTLDAVAATACSRRVLALDGEPGSWIPPGFDVIAQREGGLGARLAGVFDAIGGPAVVVGMDTPQLEPEMLASVLASLDQIDTDAVLGPACDGGYWAIGMHQPDPRVFSDVPMSTRTTGARQLARLEQLGYRVAHLPMLHDVDTFDDATAVARLAPHSRFATTFRSLLGSRQLVAR